MYFYEPSKEGTVTAASGIWSGNTLKVYSGLCRQVLIKPATSSTTFNFSLTDNEDRKVYERKDNIGELNELLSLPMKGIYTAAIAGSSADEDYTVLLAVKERY